MDDSSPQTGHGVTIESRLDRDIHVSVVVPAYNRKQEVRNCLRSLSLQEADTPRFEVIVVDDGSDDGTYSSLVDQSEFPFIFKVVRCNRLGPGAARNLGAACSRGKIILFIDSDCVAPRDWVRSLSEQVRRHGTAVGGPVSAPAGASSFAKAVTYITHTWAGGWGGKWRMFGLFPGYRLRGMNFGLESDVFRSEGGFGDLWYGEDTELSERLLSRGHIARNYDGARITHCESRSIYHYGLEAMAKGRTVLKLIMHRVIPFRLLYIVPIIIYGSAGVALALAALGVIGLLPFKVTTMICCLMLLWYGLKGSWRHMDAGMMITIPVAGLVLHVCYALGMLQGMLSPGVPSKGTRQPGSTVSIKGIKKRGVVLRSPTNAPGYVPDDGQSGGTGRRAVINSSNP